MNHLKPSSSLAKFIVHYLAAIKHQEVQLKWALFLASTSMDAFSIIEPIDSIYMICHIRSFFNVRKYLLLMVTQIHISSVSRIPIFQHLCYLSYFSYRELIWCLGPCWIISTIYQFSLPSGKKYFPTLLHFSMS